MTDPLPILRRLDAVPSPALLVFPQRIQSNIARMIAIAGSPARLRPHCKTHKMREPIVMAAAQGIGKHKAATIAECEMLATAGAGDVLFAYPVVGPNIDRLTALVRRFPQVRWSATVDHPLGIERLNTALLDAGVSIDAVLDLDVGLGRTGVRIGQNATELYQSIGVKQALRPGGFHVYDGHNSQTDWHERRAAIAPVIAEVLAFRDRLAASGLPVPRIVCGGTGGFPVYAECSDPAIELSPGTCVLHDAGYAKKFPDLVFDHAAWLLTRVISRISDRIFTCDLGSKAVASDPPMERRAVFPSLPDAVIIKQNEEHLVVESALGASLQPGDPLLALPWHVCPTTALHAQVVVVEGDAPVGHWQVVARDRQLTI